MTLLLILTVTLSFCRGILVLFLSSAAALFTSLALNAAKSSVPFGRIKRHHKAWWSAEVEEAVSERRKAFAAAYRSDDDRQAYIFTSRRASSVIAKAGRRLALFSYINLTLNLYILFFTRVAGSSSSPNCSSPRESASVFAAYLRSHYHVSPLEATFPSFAEPRALRSLTSPSAHSFPLLNFLRLFPTFSRPLPLAHTKLPTPMLKHLCVLA